MLLQFGTKQKVQSVGYIYYVKENHKNYTL